VLELGVKVRLESGVKLELGEKLALGVELELGVKLELKVALLLREDSPDELVVVLLFNDLTILQYSGLHLW